MIVGIVGIMMSGAVYAPLIPSDAFDRVDSLVRQVNAKLVLSHRRSPSHLRRFSVPVVDIDARVHCSKPLDDSQVEQLSRVVVAPDSIAYVVFTSGSTGTPKAVQLRHRNFMSYMQAHAMQNDDIVLQLASSSFDVHLDEINGALVRGAHLVLLKIDGHLDVDYVTKVIDENHVTFVAPVPSWMDALVCRRNVERKNIERNNIEAEKCRKRRKEKCRREEHRSGIMPKGKMSKWNNVESFIQLDVLYCRENNQCELAQREKKNRLKRKFHFFRLATVYDSPSKYSMTVIRPS
jgi:acyl-CoA synthetase (AMP-forming)/AMP-acid ligase II